MALTEWNGLRTRAEERELKQLYKERIGMVRDEIEGVAARYTKEGAFIMGCGYGLILACSRAFDPSMLPLGILTAVAIETGMIMHDAERVQFLDSVEHNLRWKAKAANIWLNDKDNT